MFWLNLAIAFLSQMRAVEYCDSPVVIDLPCPAACGAPLYAPMPVGLPMPTPGKTYRVDVRFTGPTHDVPPSKLSPHATEAMPAASMCLTWYANGAPKCGTVSAAIKESRGDHVELDLGFVSSGPKGWSCQAVQTVHLNTPTSVVLKGDCPEPCTAEVTVVAAAMPTVMPTPPLAVMPSQPCPTDSLLYVKPVYTAPATYATPVTYASPIPVCCPPPTPPMSVAPVQFCSIPTPTEPVRSTRLTLVRDGDKSRVRLASGKQVVTGAKFVVEHAEAGKITVTAGKSRVHVVGKAWKAEAESIEARDDGTFTLRGHVKLSSDKLGTGAKVTADELCFKVTRGSFDRIEVKGVQIREAAMQPILEQQQRFWSNEVPPKAGPARE